MNDVADYFLTWANDPRGYFHLVMAIAALLFGALIVLRRKGDLLHVVAGYIYVASMTAVNVSALTIYDLSGGPNLFHAAAIFSLITLILGFSFAIAFRRTKKMKFAAMHGTFMIWSYFGLVLALIAETFTRAVPYMLHGEGGWTRFTLALAAFMLIAGVFTNRLIKKEIARSLDLR